MGAVGMRNHARELSIMSRGSHLVFSRDALKRASRSTNPPFRLPRLQGTAAPVRIRGVTREYVKEQLTTPWTRTCACAPELAGFIRLCCFASRHASFRPGRYHRG